MVQRQTCLDDLSSGAARFAHQERIVRQFREGDVLLRSERMLRRHDRLQLIVQKRLGIQLRMFGLHLHEAEIDVIVQDQLLHLTGPADLDLDFQIRKFGLQLANQPRQQMDTGGDGRAVRMVPSVSQFRICVSISSTRETT